MKSNTRKSITAYLMLTACMLVWGSLAVFVKKTALTSSQLVLCRVILGLAFLCAVYFAGRNKTDRSALKKYGIRLLLSGVIMGFNWVCLFQSYKFTSVSVATLCYYTAPVAVILGSFVFYREKITVKKITAVITAVAGLVLITGTSDGSVTVKGIIYGLASAALYAGVTLINKSVKGISGLSITIVQLVGAAVVMLPYTLIKDGIPTVTGGAAEVVSILILGFIHTGAALYMYFSSIQALPVSAVAVISYIDPASALFFAAVFLDEKAGLNGIIGAVLIIGGAVISEFPIGGRKKTSHGKAA